jgi:hypothetical protein
VEHAIVAVHYRATYPDGDVDDEVERMPFKVWADPMEDGDFACVPHSDAPPPTT